MIIASINFDSVFASLDGLSDSLKNEVLVSGAAAAARVIYGEVRSRSPTGTKSQMRRGKLHTAGTLRDSIYRVYVKSKSNESIARYEVGWNRGKAWYSRLVEFGHWSRPVIPSGKSRSRKKKIVKWVPAYPFFRPSVAAFPVAIEAAKTRMIEKLNEIKS